MRVQGNGNIALAARSDLTEGAVQRLIDLNHIRTSVKSKKRIMHAGSG